jgi:hypothetical protein
MPLTLCWMHPSPQRRCHGHEERILYPILAATPPLHRCCQTLDQRWLVVFTVKRLLASLGQPLSLLDLLQARVQVYRARLVHECHAHMQLPHSKLLGPFLYRGLYLVTTDTAPGWLHHPCPKVPTLPGHVRPQQPTSAIGAVSTHNPSLRSVAHQIAHRSLRPTWPGHINPQLHTRLGSQLLFHVQMCMGQEGIPHPTTSYLA